MKRLSPARIGPYVLIFAVAAALLCSTQSAQAIQEPSIALLLQQTPAQGGTISPQIGVHHYALGTTVTLIAVPKPGYQFVYWLGDVLDPTANKTLAFLSKPKIIVAVFLKVSEDHLIVGQNASGGGGSGAVASRNPSFGPSAVRSGVGGGGARSLDRRLTPGDSIPPDANPGPLDYYQTDDTSDDTFDDTSGDTFDDGDPFDPPPAIPEPATVLLLGLGGLALLRKRRAQ